MRVVLDTNILVSGLARSDNPPGRILSAWRSGEFVLATSDPLIEEFRRVVGYPKVRRLLARAEISEADLRDFLDILRMRAVMVETGTVQLDIAPRDARDHAVLATFHASGAEWLVTGDKRDVLSLGLRQIVTAREFLARMEALRTPPLAEQPRAPYRVARERRRRAVARREAAV